MQPTNTTPGQYVKAWAKDHPDLEAEVQITSLTPKGKGGWGTTRKATTFYIKGGKAAQTRGKWRLGIHNGWCEVCGRIHLDLVLMIGHAADPDAGQPVPPGQLSPMIWPEYTYQFAPSAFVTACPSCVREHGLDTTRRHDPDFDEEHKVKFVTRLHPQLTKFHLPPVTILIDLLTEPITVQVIDRRRNGQ